MECVYSTTAGSPPTYYNHYHIGFYTCVLRPNMDLVDDLEMEFFAPYVTGPGTTGNGTSPTATIIVRVFLFDGAKDAFSPTTLSEAVRYTDTFFGSGINTYRAVNRSMGSRGAFPDAESARQWHDFGSTWITPTSERQRMIAGLYGWTAMRMKRFVLGTGEPLRITVPMAIPDTENHRRLTVIAYVPWWGSGDWSSGNTLTIPYCFYSKQFPDPDQYPFTVGLKSGSAVAVSGTPSVSISNTPSVQVLGTPSVSVNNTPSVSISGTPTFSISGIPSVAVSNSPTVSLSPGTQVGLVANTEVRVGNTVAVSPHAVSVSSMPSIQLSSGSVSIAGTVSCRLDASTIDLPVYSTYENPVVVSTLGTITTDAGSGGFETVPVHCPFELSGFSGAAESDLSDIKESLSNISNIISEAPGTVDNPLIVSSGNSELLISNVKSVTNIVDGVGVISTETRPLEVTNVVAVANVQPLTIAAGVPLPVVIDYPDGWFMPVVNFVGLNEDGIGEKPLLVRIDGVESGGLTVNLSTANSVLQVEGEVRVRNADNNILKVDISPDDTVALVRTVDNSVYTGPRDDSND